MNILKTTYWAVITCIGLLSFQSAFAQMKIADNFMFIPGIQISDLRNDKTNTHYLAYGADITISEGFGDDNSLPFGIWASGGENFIKDGQPAKLYGEAGIWCVFNIGIGYSSSDINKRKNNSVHAFVGLPLPLPIINIGPLGKKKKYNLQYILFEPYCRMEPNTNNYVELGILLKIPFGNTWKM